jgi:hypothetical protein
VEVGLLRPQLKTRLQRVWHWRILKPQLAFYCQGSRAYLGSNITPLHIVLQFLDFQEYAEQTYAEKTRVISGIRPRGTKCQTFTRFMFRRGQATLKQQWPLVFIKERVHGDSA